ncbi:MAG: hypothetical protein LC121_23075 [Anaerolineae bacterium]|nr:hypothetical protein [Anaerolineae bacterium]
MTESRALVGIDGGGSAVRVVVTTPDLTLLGQAEGGAVNPGTVGRAAAAVTIQNAVRAALDAAGVSHERVAVVGIGVAGAAASHSAGWLREVVSGVTPGARVVPSADYEIALVGALGRRRGVLILAGTGSLAYGVNARGRSALAGGWGYLLGDEGSGYWLGLEGLRAVVRAADGRGPQTALSAALLEALELSGARDLIAWLYRAGVPRTPAIARLAEVVLAAAADGDPAAGALVARGAQELAHAARAVMRALSMRRPAIAFAGGLLSAPNPLSEALCARLGLPALPTARYSPAIGAALLARDALKAQL